MTVVQHRPAKFAAAVCITGAAFSNGAHPVFQKACAFSSVITRGGAGVVSADQEMPASCGGRLNGAGKIPSRVAGRIEMNARY